MAEKKATTKATAKKATAKKPTTKKLSVTLDAENLCFIGGIYCRIWLYEGWLCEKSHSRKNQP